MNRINELIQTKRLYFDGGTGTVLQSMGLKPGEAPELWNLTNPDKITALHNAYLDAGCDIIKTNTFGINRDKYENYNELILAAFNCAKAAVSGRKDKFIAFDMGPTGRLLEPLGDLSFEDAVSLYAANIQLAADNGADLILIETMNDCHETKAAVLAAKETCSLPVFVTNAYDESGKLMTGASPASMVAMLESLGVDALGMNCSFGPDKMLEIIDEFTECISIPLIMNPNAGLPKVVDGKTQFDISAQEFSNYMTQLADKGACILGGCCGTTPEYLSATIAKTRELPYSLPHKKEITCVSSYTHAVTIGKQPILIGERINPTGKRKLKEALRGGDMNYILNEGLRQTDAGVQILDVNVGLPEINEVEVMTCAVTALQAVTDTPLQLDSSNPAVLEKAMRIYNGKPLINSVNGELESMDAIFPLVQKYGGAVIALTMDKNGIPETARERTLIAERIINHAAEYGIEKKDIIVDPLCLTVSSNADSALITLESVRMLHDMGICTSLGVSNISFGLPKRDKINSVFFANALENGLDCAIMNPFSKSMMDVYYAFRALHNLDTACGDYIRYADALEAPATDLEKPEQSQSLRHAIVNGLRSEAVTAVLESLKINKPLDIINKEIIPALNEIGTAFEEKRAYLPQLLMSAEAASNAFEEIKKMMPAADTKKSHTVILATVKGDIHDIGKNIVKVLLESYGFKVYDLGRDVAPEAVCDCVTKTGCRLVGLSALMTTTVPAMEETIRKLHEMDDSITVIVGGAVLTQEYADMIHADFYGADAMDSVRYAEKYYSLNQ